MRGALVFLTAVFLGVVWFIVGATAFEPLLTLAFEAPLPPGWEQHLKDLRFMLFVVAPFTWIGAWFLWGVRYYVSPSKFQKEVGPR